MPPIVLGGVSHVTVRRLEAQAALWRLSRRVRGAKDRRRVGAQLHADFESSPVNRTQPPFPLGRSLAGAAEAMQNTDQASSDKEIG